MDKMDMEEALCLEIDGAVFEYSSFCQEFFEFEDQGRGATIMKTLAQEPLFNHEGQPWTIDCTGLKGNEDNQAWEAVATILDTISKAAFKKDQFRPVRSTIRPFHKQMDADDPDDTNIQPDVVQAPIYLEDRSHWAGVEFFAECKADLDKQGEANPNKLKHALMQLARYAHATLVHQIYRLHVFAIVVCGTKATFVRLGHSGILHSPLIDLSTDFKTFVLATAGLFALEPLKFGYNTDFYFWPKLTGGPNECCMEPNEDHKLKELRVRAGNRIWRVVDVLCQRKCLVGRATLVLLLSQVKNKKQWVVLKLIWRDKLRKDEGENLKLFKGSPGICQCKWNEIRRYTAVKKEKLEQSSTFFAPWWQAEPKASQSDSTDVSLDTKALSDPTKPAVLEKGREGMLALEDRELSLIIMDEGIGLWRIKRLPHLLRVLRDALVGFAKICLEGEIHRDISEGNILCALPVDDSVGKDIEPWSENKATLLDLDSEEGTSSIEGDPDLVLNKMDLQPGGGKIDAKTLDDYVNQRYGIDKCVCNPPLTSEVGDIDTPMPDSSVNQQSKGDLDTPMSGGQVNQQFGSVKCLGRLHDLEFMVDQIRGESRGATRTGALEFIAGKLLLATPDWPVSHTYLHDLESFFWVLVWMMVTYVDVERGKKMNNVAFRLFNKFCTTNPRALGYFKKGFMCTPGISMENIANLENGWNLEPACDLVYFLAELLHHSIYNVGRRPEGVPKSFVVPEGQWPTIKYVIDKFDIAISKLPTS